MNSGRCFVFGLAASLAASACAQVSAYYATDGTSSVGSTHVYQGGSESFSYAWAAAGEMPIAIGDFGSGVRVRQAVGQPLGGSPMPGDEYDLNGNPTGFQNTWNSSDPANITGYDAGFDGTSIFMVDWGGPTTGAVYSYDNNYNGRTFLFQANPGDIGITYDSGTQTIWTSNFNTGFVQQWSMSGTPMNSFTAAGGSAAALAYDAQDGTLWMSDGFNGLLLLNYDRSGNIIQRVVSNEYLLGGEMAAVPEPATLTALGVGALLALRRRRSKA